MSLFLNRDFKKTNKFSTLKELDEMSLKELLDYEADCRDGVALDYIVYKRCRVLLESAVKKGGCELYFSDVAQDVLKKFYEEPNHKMLDYLTHFSSEEEIKKILCKVFYNKALDSWKECYGQCRKAQNAQAVRDMVRTSPDISQLYEEYPEMEGSYVLSSRKEAQTLQKIVFNQLSNPLDRQILHYKIEGYSSSEIVMILAPSNPGINVQMVDNHYSRTRNKLREKLSKDYPEYFVA